MRHEKEEWRQAHKYPLYQISSLGRIRRKRRLVKKRSRRGRNYVTLRRGNVRDTVAVDIVVASTFKRPLRPCEKVIHRAGSGIDHARNLMIVSQRAHGPDMIAKAIQIRATGAPYSAVEAMTGVHRVELHRARRRAQSKP